MCRKTVWRSMVTRSIWSIVRAPRRAVDKKRISVRQNTVFRRHVSHACRLMYAAAGGKLFAGCGNALELSNRFRAVMLNNKRHCSSRHKRSLCRAYSNLWGCTIITLISRSGYRGSQGGTFVCVLQFPSSRLTENFPQLHNSSERCGH